MLGYFGYIFKHLSNKIELKSATLVQHSAQKRQHEPKGAQKYIIMEAFWHHFRIIFWSLEPSWFFVNFWRVPDAQMPVKHKQNLTFYQLFQINFSWTHLWNLQPQNRNKFNYIQCNYFRSHLGWCSTHRRNWLNWS